MQFECRFVGAFSILLGQTHHFLFVDRLYIFDGKTTPCTKNRSKETSSGMHALLQSSVCCPFSVSRPNVWLKLRLWIAVVCQYILPKTGYDGSLLRICRKYHIASVYIWSSDCIRYLPHLPFLYTFLCTLSQHNSGSASALRRICNRNRHQRQWFASSISTMRCGTVTLVLSRRYECQWHRKTSNEKAARWNCGRKFAAETSKSAGNNPVRVK